MNVQNGNYENKISFSEIFRNENAPVSDGERDSIKISDEEINSIECFSKLSALQKEELKDFIFSLSLVLYKALKNGSA